MSAVDWTELPEPWRTVGPDWAKQAEHIARNTGALTPPATAAAKWKIQTRPARPMEESEGARLRDKRLAAGLSQDALAKRLGVSQTIVCKAERGFATRWIERCLAAIDDRTSAREAAATRR